jgi:hypothetical protein
MLVSLLKKSKRVKHICIFLAFQNIEIIKTSFDSIYTDNIDYFIIENPSENSKEIENYFKTKRLKGYIQFDKNIAANAVNIFIKEYFKLLNSYDYITITDGDLYLYDCNIAFKEIVQNLLKPNTLISSLPLYKGNLYALPKETRKIGISHYREFMKIRPVSLGGTCSHSANNMITFHKSTLPLIQSIYYLDSNIKRLVQSKQSSWQVAHYSFAYHLTWDLYVSGNPYYEWKKKVISTVWKIEEHSNYRKIII